MGSYLFVDWNKFFMGGLFYMFARNGCHNLNMLPIVMSLIQNCNFFAFIIPFCFITTSAFSLATCWLAYLWTCSSLWILCYVHSCLHSFLSICTHLRRSSLCESTPTCIFLNINAWEFCSCALTNILVYKFSLACIVVLWFVAYLHSYVHFWLMTSFMHSCDHSCLCTSLIYKHFLLQIFTCMHCWLMNCS